jgi:hypothetical protein
MKTKANLLVVRSFCFLLLVLAAMFLSNCSSTKQVCTKKEINSPCGCNPYYERIYKLGISLDKVSSKEITRCINNVSLNAKVLDKEYVDLSLNGCISSSKKIDSLTKVAIIKSWNEIPIPTQQYEDWLTCVKEHQKPKPNKRGIILMDSHISGVVYCDRTREVGGSNADDILRLIDNSKVIPFTVSTNLQWMDEQRVIDLASRILEETKKPALIVIHASAFYEKTQEFNGNTKLLLFLESLKDENVKILVYTRGLPEESTSDIEQRFKNVVGKVDELKGKAFLLVIDPKQNPCFDNPEVGMAFKNKVKEILNMDKNNL